MRHRITIYSACFLLCLVGIVVVLHDAHAMKKKRLSTWMTPVVLDEQNLSVSTYATLTMHWKKVYRWTVLTLPPTWTDKGYIIELWDHENKVVPGFAAAPLQDTTIDISSLDATRYPKIRVVIFHPRETVAPTMPARPKFYYTVQPNTRLFIVGSALAIMMFVLAVSGIMMRITPLALLRETIMLLRRYPPAFTARQIVLYAWLTMGWAGMFGITLGTFIGGIQLLYLFLKIPFLLLGALIMTIMTNAVLTLMLGMTVSLRFIFVHAFAVMATIATSLAAFIPVILFFILYPKAHDTMLVIVVVLFAVSACAGALRLFDYFREKQSYVPALLATACWVVVYGAVVMQWGWMLRPWVGVRDPVTHSVPFSRLYSGNVIVELVHTFQRL